MRNASIIDKLGENMIPIKEGDKVVAKFDFSSEATRILKGTEFIVEAVEVKPVCNWLTLTCVGETKYTLRIPQYKVRNCNEIVL